MELLNKKAREDINNLIINLPIIEERAISKYKKKVALNSNKPETSSTYQSQELALPLTELEYTITKDTLNSGNTEKSPMDGSHNTSLPSIDMKYPAISEEIYPSKTEMQPIDVDLSGKSDELLLKTYLKNDATKPEKINYISKATNTLTQKIIFVVTLLLVTTILVWLTVFQ